MDRQEREEWAEWARPLVERIRESEGITSLSDATGVNRQTIYDLLDGATPAVKTVRRLDPALTDRQTELTSGPSGEGQPEGEPDFEIREEGETSYVEVKSGEGWEARRKGSPAEQLIYMVQHPEMLRRFSGTPSMKDAVKAAFAIAVDEDFPDEEMDKLQAWRRDVLSQESD